MNKDQIAQMLEKVRGCGSCDDSIDCAAALIVDMREEVVALRKRCRDLMKQRDEARDLYWRVISKSPPDYQQDCIVVDDFGRLLPAINNTFDNEPEFIYFPNQPPPEGYTPRHWIPLPRKADD
jgi:hypothetical protein